MSFNRLLRDSELFHVVLGTLTRQKCRYGKNAGREQYETSRTFPKRVIEKNCGQSQQATKEHQYNGKVVQRKMQVCRVHSPQVEKT